MSMLSELEPGLTGLAQLQALIASGRQPPLHETLDIALVFAEEGRVLVEATPGLTHLNPAGIIHGGYAASVMDTACGCAAHSVLPAGVGFSTVELNVAYHRPLTHATGLIRAEGKLVSQGRSVLFSEARMTDAAGRVLASATSTLLVISGR